MNKIILKVVLVLLMIVVSSARVISVKDNLWWLDHRISQSQQETLYKVFVDSRKYDLSWTSTAIAWQESQFGKYKINLEDPSCGYFHRLLPELTEQLGKKPNNWNMSRTCEKLMDYKFSFQVFISTWNEKNLYCKMRHTYKPSIWKCTVMAYNSIGNKEYYLNIVNKIKALKIWLKRQSSANPTLNI